MSSPPITPPAAGGVPLVAPAAVPTGDPGGGPLGLPGTAPAAIPPDAMPIAPAPPAATLPATTEVIVQGTTAATAEALEAAQGVPVVPVVVSAVEGGPAVDYAALLVQSRLARLRDRCRLDPALAADMAPFLAVGFGISATGEPTATVGDRVCILHENEVETRNTRWNQGKKVPL